MSFRDKLIGAWELVSWISIRENDPDDVIYPWGEDCTGIITYTPDGYMGAQLNRAGAPNYSKSALRGTTEEYAEVAARTISYTGPFSIEQNHDGSYVLCHHVKLSSSRAWIGGVQRRPAMMEIEDGNTFLHLRPDEALEDEHGVRRNHRLKWRKMEDSSRAKPPAHL